ncbi:MAG TPA: malto-oligosyltrehalose trehalohydrolase [Thermodesulfobacteriota bacterium]
MKIGANYLGNGNCEFVVWATFREKVELLIFSPLPEKGTSPVVFPMEKDELGYWKTLVEDVYPGTLYLYRLDGEKERPDPASYCQPKGVHGPSQVIDHNSSHREDSNWGGIDIAHMIMYEIHTGTFTPEGTFEAIIPRLDAMLDLGINAIELMPVAQFPGERNWGYDGVFPYAPQISYGGPKGLIKLINECHKRGLAFILDVVYNHLGPEGNYLRDYGPYFTDKYRTPWGNAINFDDAYSDEVRDFFIQNAIFWFEKYHVDALRLDAIHAMYDFSAKHILEELAEKVEELSEKEDRKFYLIAESDLNDSRIIEGRKFGGYGIDAQWCDDFHHSLHTLLTGERSGYYLDFGKTEYLIRALKEGFVYSGQYSVYRKRRHGNSPKERSGKKFVVYSHNHDHIGNRLQGERLSTLISFEGLKLAAGVVLLSPYIPFLFMGEEYGEDAPFLYFVSHSDPDLIQAVRKGRKEEFESFDWKGELPDPQSSENYVNSRIDWEKRNEGSHNVLLNYYRELIKLRREIPALSNLNKDNLEVWGLEKEKVVFMRRWDDQQDTHVFSIFNLSESNLDIHSQFPDGRWKKLLDSSEKKWNGQGSLTPELIGSQDEVAVRGYGLSLFIKI